MIHLLLNRQQQITYKMNLKIYLRVFYFSIERNRDG